MLRTSSVVFVLFLSSCAAVGPSFAPGDGSLYRVQQKEKWGFINSSGRVVIPPVYTDVYYQFSEGLAAVQIERKWGYIDSTGAMVIAPRFDSAEPFHDGLAAVLVGELFEGKGKWGYIDRSGRYVLEPSEKYMYGGFADQRMSVKIAGKWGYVDPKGQQVIPARYSYASEFSEGLAWVEGDDASGFIDAQGALVIHLKHAKHDYGGFHEGLARVRDEKTNKLGFINKKGEYAILPRFDRAESFSEGRAAVCFAELDVSGWPVRKWGYIDPQGRLVVAAKYDHAWEFAEGMAQVELNKKIGFIDCDGKEVIPCRFDSGSSFWHGLAWVSTAGYGRFGWSGYIDKNGRYVWRPADFRDRDEARIAEENRPPSIKLLTDPRSQDKGLLVNCTRQVQASGDKAGVIEVTVLNYLDEEVFLQVTGFDELGCTLEDRDGGFYGGGGGIAIFPDNAEFLKRLHASIYARGQRFTCGCCRGRIVGKLAREALLLGESRGTVDIVVHGFYRKSGTEFCERVELPIEVMGAGPTTAPSQKDDQER